MWFFDIVNIFNMAVFTALLLAMAYRIVFIIVGLCYKKKYKEAKADHEYAILIAGRNESNVIGNLIDSIKQQNYDQSKLKIFVVADNCTDNTADIAREHGATVFERFNKEFVGKGFALDFMLENMAKTVPDYKPEAYIIFDADNLLDINYIKEMNKAFDSGEEILTSYRASKNFDTNWISAGCSLYFMKECRFLHTPRAFFKTSTFVSGTGFLVSSKILNPETGWKYSRLTEDLEFSTDSIIDGKKVGYVDDAVFYDEQPETFKGFWNQRIRWTKGVHQCCTGYTLGLLSAIFNKFTFFAAFEMFTMLSFSVVGLFWGIAYNTINCIYWGISFLIGSVGLTELWTSVSAGLLWGLGSYLIAVAYAAITMIKERKRIQCSFWKKVFYCFMNPLFYMCMIPMPIFAIFRKIKWVPIPHTCSKSIEQISNEPKK